MMSRLCARAAAMSALAAAIATGLPAGAEAQREPEAPTFSRDAAPILWRHCGECHRPGGAAPFSLLT